MLRTRQQERSDDGHQSGHTLPTDHAGEIGRRATMSKNCPFETSSLISSC